MANLIDLTGMKFGRLTVLRQSAPIPSTTAAIWACRCECGEITDVASPHLRSGATRSCGCLARDTHSIRLRNDITGMKFGKLTVIEFSSTGGRSGSMWKCACDCGNSKVVRGSTLRTGHTTSCGCNRKVAGGKQAGIKSDIAGKRFGMLTAITEDGRGNGGKIYWRCLCDCGAEKRVRGTDLRHGNTKSCGCQQKAKLRK